MTEVCDRNGARNHSCCHPVVQFATNVVVPDVAVWNRGEARDREDSLVLANLQFVLTIADSECQSADALCAGIRTRPQASKTGENEGVVR